MDTAGSRATRTDLITSGIPGTGFSGVPTIFQGMVPAALIPAAAGQFAKTAAGGP
jgi:hypothetical protein